MMDVVVKNIIRIIDEKGLKRKYVAARVGIKEATLSNYLNGVSRIRADMIPLFCVALNVEPNDIYAPVKEAS